MTTKHYPGPWRAADAPSSIVGWPVVAQSGRLICNVSFIQKTDDITGPEYAAYKEQCGANARLIAAAPALRNTLQALVSAFDGYENVDPYLSEARTVLDSL